MKRIIKSLFTIAAIFVAMSCMDESLDPLNMSTVKKGSILALRGTQLNNLYFQGKPGYEVFPRIWTGTETFAFDAEFLAEDVTTLASVDIFVLKRTTVGGTTTREAMLNVPFSQFKQTDDYKGPWVSVSIPMEDMLDILGLDSSSPTFADDMLALYPNGITVESDLNLTDGTKVLASQLVAAGLYQSNQFYPAQRLNIAVTDYCSYSENDWAGTYDATETSEFFGGYGPYDVTFSKDGATPNKFNTDNWYDSGIPIYIVFTPSTNVETQIVTAPVQEFTTGSGAVRLIEGSGTYNSCKKEMVINFTYKSKATGDLLDAFLWSLKQK